MLRSPPQVRACCRGTLGPARLYSNMGKAARQHPGIDHDVLRYVMLPLARLSGHHLSGAESSTGGFV